MQAGKSDAGRSIFDRRNMDGIGMIERLRPEPPTPFHLELIGLGFHRELAPLGLGVAVNDLKMAQLVKERVIEQEPPDGNRGPRCAATRPKMLG